MNPGSQPAYDLFQHVALHRFDKDIEIYEESTRLQADWKQREKFLAAKKGCGLEH